MVVSGVVFIVRLCDTVFSNEFFQVQDTERAYEVQVPSAARQTRRKLTGIFNGTAMQAFSIGIQPRLHKLADVGEDNTAQTDDVHGRVRDGSPSCDRCKVQMNC